MTIYTTPQPIFDALNAEFRFRIDLCADADNAKCPKFLMRSSALQADWNGIGSAWLNPPYGREISEWMCKASDVNRCLVCCIPARTNPPWWHDYVIGKADEIRFVRRKVSFANGDGIKGVPPWGVAIVVYRQNSLRRGSTVCTSWDWRIAS